MRKNDMVCCGKKIHNTTTVPRYHSNNSYPNPDSSLTQHHQMRKNNKLVYFKYMGKTRLTVIGAITKTKYLFSETDAIVGVIKDDSYSMTAVPKLKWVKNNT